jgi:hypothetical protein
MDGARVANMNKCVDAAYRNWHSANMRTRCATNSVRGFTEHGYITNRTKVITALNVTLCVSD